MAHEISSYEQQGIDFLTETGTTITVKFIGYKKHFDDDKEPRDVYEITLSRDNRSYTFNFGQSINKSKANRQKPTAYNVLCCLQKYEVGTFENFCGDFGYDTDSRKAEKVYNAVREEYLQVSRLFNDQELEKMQEIQ